MGKFTSEEIQIAKAVDLVDLAEQVGIPLKRKGRFYQAVGMDSVMIFNRSSWCRFSQGVGDSTIDFLEYFKSMDFVEAVKYLLEFSGYIRTGTMQKAQQERQPGKPEETKQKKESPKEPFVLPPKSETSRRLYGYLMKQRKLSKKVIDFWIKKGLLYESGNYHNLVFVGKDPEGVPRFASQRGTLDKYGKPFKGDVPGNDKTYGVNLVNTHSDTLHVYEAAIDAMSDMELRGDCQTNILVLGMLSDGPLEKFLKDYPHIRNIQFCLDNDIPGRKAVKKLAKKYTLMGYEVFVRLPPVGKDYNAFLQYAKENQELSFHIQKGRTSFTERKRTEIQKTENPVGYRNIAPYQIAQAR